MKILLVEDDWKLRKIARDFLKKNNYIVFESENGEEALDIYHNNKIDLVILDIMLPKLNGFEVCREIREENKDIPIILLTAKSSEEDILKGYKLEADEYITKPISMKVLVAKVKALLKRNHIDEIIQIEDLKIDNYTKTIIFHNKILDISIKEFQLLYYMAINKNITLSREKLIVNLWGYDYEGDIRAIDSHIKRLRKKLDGKFISTVRGLGYRFGENYESKK